MRSLKASEFKARCLAVLEEVRRTGEPVTILKRGRPVARLIPALSVSEGYPQERLRGTVEIVGDIVSPALPVNAWKALRPRRPRRA